MKGRTVRQLAEGASAAGLPSEYWPRGMRCSIPLLSFVVAVSILAPSGVGGQEFSGPLVAAGQLRFEINSLFLFADRRFGQRMEGGSLIEKGEPLGFDFEDAAVGSRLFPTLESLEADLTTATGATVTPLVLGQTQVVLTKDAVWLPIRLDVGIFDWLTVGTTVPFSRRRAEFVTSFQGDGANVGITPGTAGDFLGGLSTANGALSAIVTTLCTSNPSSPECSQATSLLAEGEGFHEALSGGYGEHGVFPLFGSDTGTALQTRADALVNAYQAVGVPSFPSVIPLATEVLTEATYLDLVTSSAFGVAGDSLKTWRSPWEMGDVEVHAYARLWETGQAIPSDGSEPGVHLKVGAGALFRLGTGRTDSPRNFIDTGSGDGQNDIEVSAFGTLSVGRRLAITGDLRYGIQQSVDVLRRITAPDRVFAPVTVQQVVRWNPGDYIQLRVSPRVYLTEEVALAFDLRFFSKKADRYRSIDAGMGPDTGLLELETKQRLLGIGGGLVFSTVRSGRGRPLEARFFFQQAVSGSGGATPKTWRVEVGLRLYRGLWE